MQFFYVLFNGITWRLASMLIKRSYQYEKTLNRTFNLWSKDNIFLHLRDDILCKYKSLYEINNLKIDSTDIINGNCNKQYLSKSLKLKKQAIKATIIIDSNNIPLTYSLTKPTIHDSNEGYNLIMKTNLNESNKNIYLAGDKGYILGKDKVANIKKTKKIIIVTPKRNYRTKVYKTKNYIRNIKCIRHSKQMKEILEKRIYIEHFNSLFHRSFKRLDKIYDKSLSTFSSFIDLCITIIIQKLLNK